MRHIPCLLAAAMVLMAAGGRDHRALEREPAPTWLPVPVAGVKPSKLRDSWGDPRSGGRTHEGIDIAAPRGTPVISATHGIIQAMRWSTNGGNAVWVLGPAGQRHYYAHLGSYAAINEGAWIDVGDTLGFVGTTGNAQGGTPHLHYGIYADDGAINPYPLLTAVRPRGAHPPVVADREEPQAKQSKERSNRGTAAGPTASTRRRSTQPAASAPPAGRGGDGGSGGVAATRRR